MRFIPKGSQVMWINHLGRALRWLAQRVVVFYALVFILSFFFIDYGDVQRKYRIATLNRIRPDFKYFVDFVNEEQPFQERQFQKYATYYEKIVELMPVHAGAHGMLGFFYDHLGKKDKAIQAYQKAKELNPKFFWYYYNLALAYIGRGQFMEARRELQDAIGLTPQHTLQYIFSSRTYQQVIFTTKYGPEVEAQMRQRLKQGYKNSFFLLSLCNEQLKDYPNLYMYAKFAISSEFADEAVFYYFAGMASYHMKNHGEAFTMFQQAIKLNPNLWEPYYYLAETMKAAGQEKMSFPVIQKMEYLKNIPGTSVKDKVAMRPVVF